jgi:glutamate transport system permease protein
VRALFGEHLGDLVQGLWVSLQLTGVGFASGVVIGVIVATMRISPIAPLRAVGMVYVEIFRNVPLMSLIILLVYALPGIDLTLGFLPSVFVALALVGGAFVCEALRSGVNSVGAGQIEAARSLGLTFAQVLAQVVFPQAFRAMVQPLVTILIGLFLSSSLAGVVGVLDLTQMTNRINNREAIGLIAFVGAAAVYVVISLLIGWVGSTIERRVRVVR